MSTIAYIPHGHCYLWQTPLVGLHAISDGLIAIAYFSIPLTLIYFVRNRRDLPYPGIFWLFSAFIVSCGLTHLVAIWTLWHPAYWLSGTLKAITASISVVTAIAAVRIFPQLLTLPSLAEMQQLNQALQREITERERVTASLRRYERIVSTTNDGICLLDAQGRYQIANETYLKWHQKTPGAVLGNPIAHVLGPATYRRKVEPYFERCLAGEVSQLELWVEYPNLGRQFMSVGYAPYQEDDGQITGVLLALRNLTALKQAEEALQQSELTQRAVLAAIPDELIRLDREGTCLSWVAGTGEPPPMLADQPAPPSMYDLLPPELAKLRLHYVREALVTNQRQTYEHDIWVDGELRHEETRIVKLNDQEVLLMVRDVTQRRQYEEQLRRYERIVSASSDGMSLIDRHYTYQIVNDTYLHYNQRSRVDIVGHSVADLLGEAVFTNWVKSKLDDCLAGNTVQYEAWFDYPATGRQFVRVSYTPYRELDGTITGVVAVTTNLTDLKQAEEALQESELRFRGIFDQMYQFIGLLSPDGTVLEANRTALDFGGLQIEDIRGRPFWEISWWQMAAETTAQLRAAIAQAAQGKFVRYEVKVRGQRGRVITIDFSLRPVFNEAGAVVWLIPEGRDISDRIQFEQELQLQAVITRNMAEGICLVRADNGIIVYANPKFEQMFGYGHRELDGQHVSIVNYPTENMTPEEVNQAIRAAVLANQEATYEVYNVKKDGTPFWCQATTSVFDHPDYGSVLVAVQQDISDRKEAQEKIQASLQEKELLLKEIYHRVKNNLQVIYSLLNLQARILTDDAAKAVLRDSQSRIRAMALVHEQLYQSANLTRIDLADYAQSLVRSLHETYCLAANEIRVRVEIDSCWIDIETALPCGLILTELVTNSFKYAFPDNRRGTITIRSAQPFAHQIQLTIQDDGIGLPPQTQLQNTPSLGLSLVRNLAKQLQGHIALLPSAQGTQFQLSFPSLESV